MGEHVKEVGAEPRLTVELVDLIIAKLRAGDLPPFRFATYPPAPADYIPYLDSEEARRTRAAIWRERGS